MSATLVLETSFRVPGLGVLAVPTLSTADGLLAYALHTALAVRLLVEGQPPLAITGTVEEITHGDQLPQRALLLDFDPGGPLPSGALAQIQAALPSLY